AEKGDSGIIKLRDSLANLFDDPAWFFLIHFAGRPYQAALLGGSIDHKPWVDSDAMTTHPGAGLENVYPRVMVGESNEFPDINAEMMADHGKFVGKCDVHITKRIFG